MLCDLVQREIGRSILATGAGEGDRAGRRAGQRCVSLRQWREAVEGARDLVGSRAAGVAAAPGGAIDRRK